MIENKDDLEKTLIKIYQYYFRHRDDRGDATTDGVYWTGKCDGAVEAIGSVYLSLFGADKMTRLWQLTLPEE